MHPLFFKDRNFMFSKAYTGTARHRIKKGNNHIVLWELGTLGFVQIVYVYKLSDC